MKKEKQEWYLSEMFLEALNGDFSLKAVLRALKECDQEMFRRSGMCEGGGKFIKRKSGISRLNLKMPRNMLQEIWDFWDVYAEFDHMLTPEMKRRYLILQMINCLKSDRCRADGNPWNKEGSFVQNRKWKGKRYHAAVVCAGAGTGVCV